MNLPLIPPWLCPLVGLSAFVLCAVILPASDRVEQIAAMLAETPSASGAPITDRQAWAEFMKHAPDLLDQADALLDEPAPELTDEVYLLFSTHGTRTEFEVVYRARLKRFVLLTQAECGTDTGKYLPAIERELAGILSEKTWVMAAHDRDLRNFKGEIRDIDLGVAMRGATVATAVSWLGDRLPADLRARTLSELRSRVFDAYLKRIRGEDTTLCRWITSTNNWNAVCHAGVVTAALAILPDVKERAEILAGAEKHIGSFLAGFTADGYCSEGMGYWNYGFGHFVTLAEVALRATDGRMDFYATDIVQRIAEFPDTLEIAPGLYPSFADCPLYPRPAAWIRRICQARLFSGSADGGAGTVTAPAVSSLLLYQAAIHAFPLTARAAREGERGSPTDPLRGTFPDAGIFVARHGSGNPAALSVAFKGGHNAEHHNHNDVGQFVVGLQGRLPVIDPGAEPYTATTFSPRRYESDIFNSRGHAVPVVAGALQRTGKAAAARVIETAFTPEEDRVILDLAAAYDVPALKKLERRFVYARAGLGSLEVRDTFEFAQPETFETALITFGRITRQADGSVLIEETDATVRVTVDTGGLPFDIVEEAITTSLKRPPVRLAIRLKDPATAGVVVCRIVPADAKAGN